MVSQNKGFEQLTILKEINEKLKELLFMQRDQTENANTNILWTIKRMLEWQGNDIVSALWYDEDTDTILVEEELLMSMIQLANIGQESKRIKLISRNEMFKIKTGQAYKK